MTGLFSLWWVWMALALGLAIVEVLAPGFVFLGIALAAALIALAMWALPDMMSGLGPSALFAMFAGLSIAAWFALRAAFRQQSSGSKVFTDDVND